LGFRPRRDFGLNKTMIGEQRTRLRSPSYAAARRRQKTEDRKKNEVGSGNFLNSEVGMRPPAHREIGLRPGGKVEKKKVGSPEVGSRKLEILEDSCQIADIQALNRPALCARPYSMRSAPCPMLMNPHPASSIQYRVPNTQYPIPSTQYPIPNIKR